MSGTTFKRRRIKEKKRRNGDGTSRSNVVDGQLMDSDFDDIEDAELELREHYGRGADCE